MTEANRGNPVEQQHETSTAGGSLLDRTLDLTRVDVQVWIFVALLIIATLLRLWDLGSRAMHHDESLHAFFSWQFYTGEQLYRYNPTFHGPLLYHLTALSYFLFGASDAIARLPEALFGVLTVASCFFLRRWLGRWGWLIAAGLLTFSPAFTYFARFARHDALAAPLTLAMAIALFRYLETRRPVNLALAGAALALSWASHELTFITLFIFVSFLMLAFLLDWQRGRFLTEGQIAATVIVATCLLAGLALGGAGGQFLRAVLVILALLSLGYLGLSYLWPRLFPEGTSPVRQAGRALLENPVPLLRALGVFGILFALLFTNFLTYPRGFLDGLTLGLKYWSGQQQVSRGGQPWFYYLLLLPTYEPIVLTGGIAGIVLVLTRGRRRPPQEEDNPEGGRSSRPAPAFFLIFLAYWALASLMLYSWAGEKMPWLLLHVALPLVLLAALALDRLLEWIRGPTLWRSGDWAVGPLFFLLALALRGVVALANQQYSHELAAQYVQLQIGVLILLSVGLIALLAWRIYRIEGRHLGQSLALVGLILLLVYTVRCVFLVNFYYGDIPRELLVYTQTAPDVPLVVRQIERLGIDQTRKVRTSADPTGGHGLSVSIDNSRNAALDWPFNWYLRDFARAGNLRNFNGVQGPPPDSDVLLVLADNEANLRPYLQGKYTGLRVKHRWWFPEFETYKRWTLVRQDLTEQGYQTMPWLLPSTYSQEGFANLWNYLLYRKLPYSLASQDFYFYVRNELLPAGGAAAQADPYIEKLAQRPALRSLGSPGSGQDQLSYPRALALGPEDYLYVADSGNHRIVRFDPQGQFLAWGGPCTLDDDNPCLGQFSEPWGVAVDQEGRVYVADTWNHRIQVFDASGNFLGQWGDGALVDVEADPRGREGIPYGFYGPRGVAVDSQGRVYVTDTGNERVLVYEISADASSQIQATYLYQFGQAGPGPGEFLEPVGIAVDAADRVYVVDTLNARVQVFVQGPGGQVSLEPATSWQVTGWDSTSRENKPFLAISPGGQVCFTVPERHYVACTDLTGKVLDVWGGYGVDTSSFNLPIGVAVDVRGQIYVSDSGNGRILVFTVP